MEKPGGLEGAGSAGGPRPWPGRGRAACALAALLGAAASAGLRAQDPPAGREGRPAIEWSPDHLPDADHPLVVFERDQVVGHFAGHVRAAFESRGSTVRLLADRMVLFASRREGAGGRRAGAEPSPEAARESGWLGDWGDFRLYAERVRVEVPERKTSFEAESLYYEHATGRGVARGARLKTTVGAARGVRRLLESKDVRLGLEAGDFPDLEADDSPFARSPLVVRADLLRFQGFEVFDGRGLEVTTCDFGVPHMSLAASTGRVLPVEERGPELEHRDFVIDPEDTWLRVEGYSVAPVPLGRWDTRWMSESPVRTVEVGSSSELGLFGAVHWNLNYFLSLVPPSRFLPLELVEDDAKLGFETAYFSKRGAGLGPLAEYGDRPRKWGPWQLAQEEWRHYGEAQHFFIHDAGDEDRTTRLPVPRDDRYWGHVWHRQSVPYVGLFDLEYSRLSDRAFLGEYFEDVAKEEKEQETLAYWRRNLFDNLAITALYKTRTNDFQTQVERLPEAKVLLLEQPVLETGLYAGLSLQAAYLHRLEDDALGLAPRGFGRYDALNEWSFPVRWFSRWFIARPFAFARLTEYGEVLDEGEGSEDRATFGAGVTASQQWSRVFRFEQGSLASWLLDARELKHVVVPKATYLNVFANDLDPEDTVPVDSVDEADLEESVSLSLRNEVFTRRPRPLRPGEAELVRPLEGKREALLQRELLETRRRLDSEVSFFLFPQPLRDNGGDRSSLLIFDNTAEVVPRLSVRAWFELDPNRDFRDERTDASATYDLSGLVPGQLRLTAGDRLTRRRSNVAYLFGDWTVGEKWVFDAYYAHDFETERDVEYSFSVARIFHRLAVSLAYKEDVGEDRNRTFYVSISPIELLRTHRRGHRR
ncbi:MAG: hypothetical protein HY721_32765 [Planctomycetes bacterium]|nr:hypothetical protein [Planctomycetota bacterium]